MKILSINTGLTKILIALMILFVPAATILSGGKGGGKTTTPFIDGFHDSQTPGVLCPWEQFLNVYTRQKDNYFCHVDYLPPNIMPAQCLDFSSRYCFRGPEAGESGSEYEAYLQECLSKDWIE